MVCVDHREIGKIAPDFTPVFVGQAMYGSRFIGADMTPRAYRELHSAVRLIDWYEHFLCRMEPDAFGVERIRTILSGS